MEKLTRTANMIDLVLKIIIGITCVIGGVFILFTILSALGFGDMTLTYTYMGVTHTTIENPTIAEILFFDITVIAILALSIVFFQILRHILKPMKEGRPFDASVSTDLRKLGYIALIGGIITIVSDFLQEYISVNQTVMTTTYDFTFIIVALFLFLFSYIFRYGETLQAEIDELL